MYRLCNLAQGLSPWASTRRMLWVFAWCGFVYPLVGASAQQAVDEADGDAGVLAELGDDEYRVRQAATRGLLADDALTQEGLDRLFVTSEIPEQRHRLLRVARHHLLRRMIDERYGKLAGPGSMGLSHQMVEAWGLNEESRAGVMVVITLPGFPAYALLEPGDVIVEFDGKPITKKVTATQFQQMIRGHQAGEVVGLTVLRDGSPIDIPFQLGNGQALGEVYDTNRLALTAQYRQAWLQERSRMEGLLGPDVEIEAQDTDSTAAPSP